MCQLVCACEAGQLGMLMHAIASITHFEGGGGYHETAHGLGLIGGDQLNPYVIPSQV